MRRPPVGDWAVFGDTDDPLPGDPDTVTMLGQDLRTIADALSQRADEIQALSSVDSWKSPAADAFRSKAGDAVKNLRKAFTRYDEAAKAIGTAVVGGSEANWASALETAQEAAARALRDAQNAVSDHGNLQKQIDNLPPNTPPDDPTAKSLHDRQKAQSDALAAATRELQAAKDQRDRAVQAAVGKIRHAMDHDGLKDGFWDKFDSAVDDALSIAGHVLDAIGNFLEDLGYTLLNILTVLFSPQSLLGILTAVLGIVIMALAAGGEAGGLALDCTGIGIIPGAALNVGAAAAFVFGAGLTVTGVGVWANAMANGDYNTWPRDKRKGPKPAQPRPADPGGDEGYGGHGDEKHVGRSDNQLRDRLANEPGTDKASTYENYGDAQKYSQQAVDGNKGKIASWLRKAKPGSKLTIELDDTGSVTGRSMSREDFSNGVGSKPVRGCTVILKADPGAPGGYYILTTFPS